MQGVAGIADENVFYTKYGKQHVSSKKNFIFRLFSNYATPMFER